MKYFEKENKKNDLDSIFSLDTRLYTLSCLSVCELSLFVPRFRKVNETSTEAWLGLVLRYRCKFPRLLLDF